MHNPTKQDFLSKPWRIVRPSPYSITNEKLYTASSKLLTDHIFIQIDNPVYEVVRREIFFRVFHAIKYAGF
jgi:hypothetical protein